MNQLPLHVQDPFGGTLTIHDPFNQRLHHLLELKEVAGLMILLESEEPLLHLEKLSLDFHQIIESRGVHIPVQLLFQQLYVMCELPKEEVFESHELLLRFFDYLVHLSTDGAYITNFGQSLSLSFSFRH